MPGARFDPGPRRGRGGALLGKPRWLLGVGGGCGVPPGMSVTENTNPGSSGGIWRITCNSPVPCAPSCTFSLALGVPLTGFSAPAPQ